jgi:hypothetical protein
MRKLLAWLKYLLPLAIVFLFKKSKASELTYSHFLDPAEAEKRDEFLASAKRPDWNEDDCYSAKLFVQELFNARAIVDLNDLPLHYFHLVDDTFLLGAKASVDGLAKKLADEKVRRGI